MPSHLDPHRRTPIYVLGAFLAGALLTVGVLRFGPQPITARREPIVAVAPAGSGTTSTPQPVAASSVAGEDASADVDPGDWPDDAPTPEQVFTAQPETLRKAIAALAPRTSGKTNVYAVAFGGDGSQDVFRNEAEYVDALVSKRFASPGHTLVLENNPATLVTRPLASWTNLEGAIDGLAKVMDPREDILVVYLATHGGSDHSLLVDMDPIPLDQLDPEGLAAILSRHAFRWKVVVVNACYSGGFVPKLSAPGTLVMTSARNDRTSFGCGADSDITYFGRAWLVDGLNGTTDFVDAFGKAKSEISAWEKKDSLLASEPQIAIGDGIQEKLAAWRKGLKAGPVVPFEPAK
ncbi:MAG TPA: C13 family peptidase [Luteibacter sp.]|uniref:C13 family peptidase n=1 Tax=Luteibacter sp. TaxID=1886636 RepID=UPI002C148B60|nr:C13 family peptidase [Luteibacter sp.]HVI56154.1 C13 family peptidase [Luteibacter sp.]